MKFYSKNFKPKNKEQQILWKVDKLKNRYEKKALKLWRKIFSREGNWRNFRSKDGIKLGICRVTEELLYKSCFIKIFNENDFLFIDCQEEFETGDWLIKFCSHQIDPKPEGGQIGFYQLLVDSKGDYQWKKI